MSSSRSIPLEASGSMSPVASRSAVFVYNEDSVSVPIAREDSDLMEDPPPREDSGTHAEAAAARPSPHAALRIVIPRDSSLPETPALRQLEYSTSSPPNAPQTATVLPQHPRYPPTLGASLGASGAYDSNVAAALSQLTTQKSAVVLLNADITPRRLREAVRGGHRRSGTRVTSPQPSPVDNALQQNPSHADSQEATLAATGFSRSFSTVNRGFIESLSQMFQPRAKSRSHNKAPETASTQDDVELQAPSHSVGPLPSPAGEHAKKSMGRGSSGGAPSRKASAAAAATAAASPNQLPQETNKSPPESSSLPHSGNRAGDEQRAAGSKVLLDSGTSGTVQDKNSGSINDGASTTGTDADHGDIGIDRVLEEAAKVRGLRLTWLLYAMIVLVICLFVLVFLLISLSTNNTIKQSGKHMIQTLTVSTTNNAELLRYDLEQFFLMVNTTFLLLINGILSQNVTAEVFCSRIYGAPIVFASYDSDDTMAWSLVCDDSRLSDADIPDHLPSDMIYSYDSARLVVHSDHTVAAYYTVTQENSTERLGTIAVFLSKGVIGRFLLSNFQPEYSTTTLQGLDLGVLLPTWSSFQPQIAFTTLTTNYPSYAIPQPTPMGSALQATFHDICGDGTSKYVWHSVVHDGIGIEANTLLRSSGSEFPPYRLLATGDSVGRPPRNSTKNDFPAPYIENKGTWGIASRMALCSVLCTDDLLDRCTLENPSSIWFVIDTSLRELKRGSALNIVGGISIVAVVLFSFILLLAYIGISLPVHFLGYQLLRAVGSKAEKSGCERRMYTMTRWFWISDLVSLVRAIHILSICFRLNKKYVPVHVLRNHAKQLHTYNGRLSLLESTLDEMGSSTVSDDEDEDEDEDDEDDPLGGSARLGEGGRADSAAHPDGMSDFAAITAAHREASQYPLAREASELLLGGTTSQNLHQSHSFEMSLRRNRSVMSGASGASPPPSRRVGPSSGWREATNSTSGHTEDFLSGRVQTSLANNDFLLAEATVDFSTVTLGNDTTANLMGAGAAGGSVGSGGSTGLNPRLPMEIRHEEDATILCVRICDVDSAYLLDYRLAIKQHRRIMRFLLSRIRHYKGAIFYRSGDCLAAAWNAFDSCYNHAEYAAACAQDIANAFAPYREQGLQVGIVLHQGTFICGTVEDTREAFVTAFGEGPRQAMTLAELAAAQPAFSILITEPVKQALSAKYECLIVDVIRIPALIHNLILFELGMPRATTATATHNAAQSPMGPRSPMSSALIVQYAKVFALFRNHEFKAALDGIQTIRQSHMCTLPVQRLLFRLELLSNYYQRTDNALPMPYSRAMPVWDNYELVAAVEGGLDGAAGCAVEEWSSPTTAAPPTDSFGGYPVLSPTSTLAPVGRGAPTTSGEDGDDPAHTKIDDPTATASPATPSSAPPQATGSGRGSAHPSSPTSATGQFALPEVLYHKVLRISDEEISFKRELLDNVKRLGTPAQKSPHIRPRKVTPLGAGSSSPSSPVSSTHTPHSATTAAHQRSYEGLDSLPPLPALPACMDAPGTAHIVSDEEPMEHQLASSSAITGLGDSASRSTSVPAMVNTPSARRHTLVVASSLTDETNAAAAVPPPPLVGLGPRLSTSPQSASQSTRQELNPEANQFLLVHSGEGALPSATPTTSQAEVHADPTSELSIPTSPAEEMEEEGEETAQKKRRATPSLRHPVSASAEDVSQHQHGFSLVNGSVQPPPMPLDPPHSATGGLQDRLGSFVSVTTSEVDVNVNSIIQSIGISLAEADGNLFLSSSFSAPAELPTQIVGKNGTTYMRSNRILGRGSFGCVYLGMDIHSGKLIAIKFLPMPSDESELGAVEAEVVIMQRVKDSHVVEFITYAFEGSNIILVMECMMAGSLQNMISAFKVIPSATARVFLRDVLRGLSKLHSMGVIHRDVKPQNVLLTLAGNCKISDFGASAWLHELARKEAEGLVLGTPVYLAPEAARGMPVQASDIWSCGIMFLQLITGELPYPKEQLNQAAPILVYQIGIGGAVPIIPDSLDELDAAFVRSCLHANPQDRKTAQQLLQMPLFTL